MVRLTADLIAKSRHHFKKNRGLSFAEYLKTLTHLHFSSKNIDYIGDLSMCRNLTVLYLYDNQITHICNLDFAFNLTHLYMQNNNITHIDNLSNLHRLSKLWLECVLLLTLSTALHCLASNTTTPAASPILLPTTIYCRYLGGNRIAVVEGLENLSELKELHLQNQRLEPGEKLHLDPTTLLSLAESLLVLNINNNNIDDIRALTVLKELQHFSAADNKLHNMEELEDVFGHWPQLLQMDLSGNPVCKKPKYRDCLITVCKGLEVLDGREINELTRQFLINWKASKEAKKKKNNTHMMTGALIPYPLINDFDTGQGPHPDHLYSHAANMQRWNLQQSLRAQNLKIPMSGLLGHVAVPSPVHSHMDA